MERIFITALYIVAKVLKGKKTVFNSFDLKKCCILRKMCITVEFFISLKTNYS